MDQTLRICQTSLAGKTRAIWNSIHLSHNISLSNPSNRSTLLLSQTINLIYYQCVKLYYYQSFTLYQCVKFYVSNVTIISILKLSIYSASVFTIRNLWNAISLSNSISLSNPTHLYTFASLSNSTIFQICTDLSISTSCTTFKSL